MQQQLLTEEQEQLQHRLRFDTPFWAGGVTKDDASGRWVIPAPDAPFRGCAKILDKRKRTVAAIPHPWQLELDEILEAQRARGLPMRVIILKARKLGFSTWIALKFLQRCTQLPDQTAVVVAQDTDTAGTILDIGKRAYSHLPSEQQLPIGFSIKPALIHVGEAKNGRKHMIFGEPSKQNRYAGATGDSIFEIDTAGSPMAGRGTTPNLLHLSEIAFWESEQAKQKMLAMLEAVPYEQETIVAMESTANGLNHFYKRWVSAREGSADPDRSGEVYVPLFVPWWRDENCSIRFATAESRERFEDSIGNTGEMGDIAEDEPMLRELYHCTPEQLLWRRMKIQEQPDKSIQTFNQENPYSDEAAFIGSGHTVFSGILIARAVKSTEAAPEPVSGTLRVPDAAWEERRTRSGTKLIPTQAVWVPRELAKHDEHELEVWEHPRTAESAPLSVVENGVERPATEFERRTGAYVLFCDVAGGEGSTLSEGDYHAVKVFDHHTRMEVAMHNSRIELQKLPLWLLEIAIYYNEARLVVEVNNMGIYIVETLHNEYRYRRMYRRDEVIGVVEKQDSNRAGWETNKATKEAMEGTFMEVLGSDLCGGIRDRQAARQLSTYVVDEKGKHGAQAGEYDDRLIAAMGAQQIMSMRRAPRIGPKRERGRPSDPIAGY